MQGPFVHLFDNVVNNPNWNRRSGGGSGSSPKATDRGDSAEANGVQCCQCRDALPPNNWSFHHLGAHGVIFLFYTHRTDAVQVANEAFTKAHGAFGIDKNGVNLSAGVEGGDSNSVTRSNVDVAQYMRFQSDPRYTCLRCTLRNKNNENNVNGPWAQVGREIDRICSNHGILIEARGRFSQNTSLDFLLAREPNQDSSDDEEVSSDDDSSGEGSSTVFLAIGPRLKNCCTYEWNSCYGTNLCCSDRGKVFVSPVGANWQNWDAIWLGGNTYHLRSHYGTYLCAQPSGRVCASTKPGCWSQWELYCVGNNFVWESYHGTYLSAGPQGTSCPRDGYVKTVPLVGQNEYWT